MLNETGLSGICSVKFSNDITEPYILTLFDMEGRKIVHHQDDQKSMQLQLNNVKNGVYLLKINNKTMNLTKRIVIQ